MFILLISFIYSCDSENDDAELLGTTTLSSTVVSNIESKSAIFKASINNNGGSELVQGGFVFSKESNPSINDNMLLVSDLTSGDFTSTVSDLDANTVYFVRAFAENKVGIIYGDESSFATNHFIHEGFIQLKTQGELDNFGSLGYTIINGNVIIGDSQESNIVSLNSLESLTEIKGNMAILGTTDLASLQGLHNIKRVYGVSISEAASLTNIDPLKNITSIDGYLGDNRYIVSYFTNNENLSNIDGLSNVSNIEGYLQFINNKSLTNLDGLRNINSFIGGIQIARNQSLANIDGLSSITSMISLDIDGNPLITNLDGLSNLTSVEGYLHISGINLSNIDGLSKLASLGRFLNIYDTKLTHLDGLVNLTSVSSINISRNPDLISIDGLKNVNSIEGFSFHDNVKLSDFCSISDVFMKDSSTTLSIHRNAYNPTKQDLINGACTKQ